MRFPGRVWKSIACNTIGFLLIGWTAANPAFAQQDLTTVNLPICRVYCPNGSVPKLKRADGACRDTREDVAYFCPAANNRFIFCDCYYPKSKPPAGRKRPSNSQQDEKVED